jgi:hypothetical protein
MIHRKAAPKSLAMYQKLALPKPESRKAQKRRQDDEDAEHVSQIRMFVWIRSTHRCELCGGWLGEVAGEMHHDPSKAKTRGRPEHERTNEQMCCRACSTCHTHQTENRRDVVFFSDRRFMGPYAVVDKAGEVFFQQDRLTASRP